MKKLDVRKFLNEILLENGVGEDVKEIYCVSMENGSGSGLGIISENWVSREEWLNMEVGFWFEEDEKENEEVECYMEGDVWVVNGFNYEKFEENSEEWMSLVGEDFYEYSKYVEENNLKGVIKSNDSEYCEVWFYIK
jgi:hypothetical protein